MALVRDDIRQPLTLDYFIQRMSEGWKLKAIEWERVEGAAQSVARAELEEVPYGLEIDPGVLQLRHNQTEIEVLLTILEMIVTERRVEVIAGELNRRGHRTRSGSDWSAPAVFDLLPRVIDMGPKLLKTKEWQDRRPPYSVV